VSVLPARDIVAFEGMKNGAQDPVTSRYRRPKRPVESGQAKTPISAQAAAFSGRVRAFVPLDLTGAF